MDTGRSPSPGDHSPFGNRSPFARGGDARFDGGLSYRNNGRSASPDRGATSVSSPFDRNSRDGRGTIDGSPRQRGGDDSSVGDLFGRSGRRDSDNGSRPSFPTRNADSSSNVGSILGGSRNSSSDRFHSNDRQEGRAGYRDIHAGGRANENRPVTDWNRRNSVTNAGQVLGATRVYDSRGRTSVGAALGAGHDITPAHGRVTYRGRAPFYGYNPRSGHYERYHDHYNGPFVSVLFGTLAPRPAYHFRYRNYSGIYYYPYYCDNALSVGFSTFPSPYFYFGYGVPAYIPSTRVIVVDRPVIIRGDSDVDDYYLSRTVEQSLDEARTEIRQAWVSDDIDLLLRHVRSEDEIPVYLQGDYKYSLPAEDYRDLTKDAMENTTTTSFQWVDEERVSGDEVRLKALHRFVDKDGTDHEVYATFTLVKSDGAWWIAEVGSSDRSDD
jgi:hypothetical protein